MLPQLPEVDRHHAAAPQVLQAYCKVWSKLTQPVPINNLTYNLLASSGCVGLLWCGKTFLAMHAVDVATGFEKATAA